MVKPGYKQTQVGTIPSDWQVDKIKNHALISTGDRNTEDKKENGRYPFFVRSQNVERIDSFSFDGEAVLTAGDGVGTGKVFHYINGKFDFHQRVYKISNFKPDLDGYYFYNVFSTHFFDRIMSMTAKSSVDSVRMEMIADMLIPLPDIQEQKAIGNTLSDVNDLIAALEKLIAKKRAIKTAVMQQLLTGKTRLPGFSGKWKVQTIDEISICLDSLRIPLNEKQRREMQGNIPYCGANGILDYVNDYVVDEDIILLAEDGGHFDEYATRPIAYRMSGKCWVNNHAHILMAKDEIDQNFLFYSIVHKDIREHLSSGTRAKLNRSEMKKIEILIPKQFEEQKAISTVLDDIDENLSRLVSLKHKIENLNTGIMQELLTGRTRLI
jgi:type I restriction enzyme S subunit